MGPTEGSCFPIRILQVHPTRRCNLRCLHCYSSSGPNESDELPVDLLRSAVTDASREGYTVAGFSGGEPLLYNPLRELLEQAKNCQMVTTVTTNGMLLDERRIEELRGAVDLLAISLDGVPASHNRIRACERAFDAMVARLDGIRKCRIPFGFIFTLTQHNLHELDWIANFSVEQGACLLQIHPLEVTGRAEQLMAGEGPDDIESAYAYLEVARIQALVGERLYVQLDLSDREVLRADPSRVFAGDEQPPCGLRTLADTVSPLVIEADGTVVPIRHGFARQYAFGNLKDAPLRELAVRWRQEQYQLFRDLCDSVYEEVTAPADLPFFNWYEVIARGGRAG